MSDQVTNPSPVQAAVANQATPPQQAQAPEAPKQDNVSAQFAALSRKERAILKKAQELQAREQSMLSRSKEVETYEQLKQNAKLNPLKLLEQFGLSYKELTDFVLNNEEPTPSAQVSTVKQELDQFKKQLEEQKLKQEEERKQKEDQEFQAAVTSFKEEIGELLESQKDKFELVNLYNQSELVYSTIEEYYKSTNKILSIEEGAQLVETYLENEAKKALASKKFGKPTEAPGSKPSSPTSSRTLNNEVSSSAPSLFGAGAAKTEEDRIKRALAKLG